MLKNQDYAGLCQQYVEDVTNSGWKGATAYDAWNNQKNIARQGVNGLNPGDTIYFSPNASNGNDGHAGIYVGNGNFISATYNGIETNNLADWVNQTGQAVLGYVPNSNTPNIQLASANPSGGTRMVKIRNNQTGQIMEVDPSQLGNYGFGGSGGIAQQALQGQEGQFKSQANQGVSSGQQITKNSQDIASSQIDLQQKAATQNLSSDLKNKMTLNSAITKYTALGMNADDIFKQYLAESPWGAPKESPNDLQKLGVTTKALGDPGTAGSFTDLWNTRNAIVQLRDLKDKWNKTTPAHGTPLTNVDPASAGYEAAKTYFGEPLSNALIGSSKQGLVLRMLAGLPSTTDATQWTAGKADAQFKALEDELLKGKGYTYDDLGIPSVNDTGSQNNNQQKPFSITDWLNTPQNVIPKGPADPLGTGLTALGILGPFAGTLLSGGGNAPAEPEETIAAEAAVPVEEAAIKQGGTGLFNTLKNIVTNPTKGKLYNSMKAEVQGTVPEYENASNTARKFLGEATDTQKRNLERWISRYAPKAETKIAENAKGTPLEAEPAKGMPQESTGNRTIKFDKRAKIGEPKIAKSSPVTDTLSKMTGKSYGGPVRDPSIIGKETTTMKTPKWTGGKALEARGELTRKMPTKLQKTFGTGRLSSEDEASIKALQHGISQEIKRVAPAMRNLDSIYKIYAKVGSPAKILATYGAEQVIEALPIPDGFKKTLQGLAATPEGLTILKGL